MRYFARNAVCGWVEVDYAEYDRLLFRIRTGLAGEGVKVARLYW